MRKFEPIREFNFYEQIFLDKFYTREEERHIRYRAESILRGFPVGVIVAMFLLMTDEQLNLWEEWDEMQMSPEERKEKEMEKKREKVINLNFIKLKRQLKEKGLLL